MLCTLHVTYMLCVYRRQNELFWRFFSPPKRYASTLSDMRPVRARTHAKHNRYPAKLYYSNKSHEITFHSECTQYTMRENTHKSENTPPSLRERLFFSISSNNILSAFSAKQIDRVYIIYARCVYINIYTILMIYSADSSSHAHPRGLPLLHKTKSYTHCVLS